MFFLEVFLREEGSSLQGVNASYTQCPPSKLWREKKSLLLDTAPHLAFSRGLLYSLLEQRVWSGRPWPPRGPWLCPKLTYRLIWVALNSGCTSETLGGLEDSTTHPGGHIPGVLDSPTAPSPQEFSWQSLFLWAFLDQPFWNNPPDTSSWTEARHPVCFLSGATAVGSHLRICSLPYCLPSPH